MGTAIRLLVSMVGAEPVMNTNKTAHFAGFSPSPVFKKKWTTGLGAHLGKWKDLTVK